ncbi:hypothetical protein D1872_183540 [compost metagenome]
MLFSHFIGYISSWLNPCVTLFQWKLVMFKLLLMPKHTITFSHNNLLAYFMRFLSREKDGPESLVFQYLLPTFRV